MQVSKIENTSGALRLCASLMLVTLCSACGGGGGSGSSAPASYGSGSSNSAPSLDLSSSIEVEENQTSVTTVAASDADGDDLSFTLSGDDADDFTIGDDGTLAFVSAPDFESKSSYSITIEVTDGTASTSQSLTVEITDLNEVEANNAPVFEGLEGSIQVNENQSNLLTVTVTDADEDAITYTLEGDDAASFEISTSGVITFVSAPDYETKSAYSITVVASDGADQVSQTLSVEIVDIAEAVSEAPVEFNLVVARGSNGYGTGNKYSINDNVSPNLNLEAGKTYRLLQSDGTNVTHPVYFSTTPNGTHGGGAEYNEGVSRVSETGSAGAYVQIIAPSGVDTLYYYCLNHSGMGGTITISASPSGSYITPMN